MITHKSLEQARARLRERLSHRLGRDVSEAEALIYARDLAEVAKALIAAARRAEKWDDEAALMGRD